MDLVVFSTKPAVRIRLADDQDAAKAKEWIDIQVPANALKALPKKLGMFARADVDWGLAEAPSPGPLGELDGQPVGEVQISALRYVQEVIEAQIRILGRRLGRNP